MDEYIEVPCKCGFTQDKNPEEFETYLLRMGTFMNQEIGLKPVPRCKTCKTISIIMRENLISEKEEYPFKDMPSVRNIVEKTYNNMGTKYRKYVK